MKLLAPVVAIATMLFISVSAQAATTTITFKEAEAGANGTAATKEYAASGVIFSNSIYYSNKFDTIDGAGIVNGILNSSGGLSAGVGGIEFVNPVSMVMFDWIALAPNQDMAVVAQDASGNEVGRFTANTLDNAFGSGSISAATIKFLFFAGNVPQAIGLSTLSFNSAAAVPLPGAALLFLSAFAFGGVIRRRKAASATA